MAVSQQCVIIMLQVHYGCQSAVCHHHATGTLCCIPVLSIVLPCCWTTLSTSCLSHFLAKNQLENVAIANALQLEAARATPAVCRFNYDAMPSLMSPNLSIAVLQRFCCWYVTLRCDLDLWPRDLDIWALTLNICSVSPVTWWNSIKFERNRTMRSRVIVISVFDLMTLNTF